MDGDVAVGRRAPALIVVSGTATKPIPADLPTVFLSGRLVQLSTERVPTDALHRRGYEMQAVGVVRQTDLTPHPIDVSATVYANWEFVPTP